MKLTVEFLLFSALLLAVTGGQQEFLDQPENITVREGGEVRLNCVVNNKLGTLQWTRDDFGLGTSRELAGYSRYRMVGEEERGEWHLLISNITVEDDARYQCQVGATETAEPIRSSYAVVTVLAQPRPPVLTSGPVLTLREDRPAMVQCISKGGKPATSITWRLDGEVVREGVEDKVEMVEASKRTITVSSLQLRGERNMSGLVLQCEATNGNKAETVSTKLEVEYKPQVSLTAERQEVYEGDSVKMRCDTIAWPALVETSWQVGGEEVEDARGATELILQADRRLAGQRVTCLARNKIGQASADLRLDIHYSPVFVKQPQDVTGDSGERVTLECLVDSNPPGEYTWIRNNLSSTSKVVGSGSSLSFFLTSQSAGIYSCQARSDGFPSLSSEASVRVRGPPSILTGREVQYGSPGETVSILCEATAVPRIQAFIWLFQGHELGTGSEAANFSIVESQQGDVVRSSLVIKQLGQQHYGDYGCKVTNQMGDAFLAIKLKPVDGLPLLIMVSAAIGGLLLTIVLIVVILTCRRVNRTPKINLDPPSKTSPQPDRFSNSSSETKANTLSSLSAGEDLDGSDSLPEYHANYIKSGQPDLVSSAGSENIKSYNYNNRAYSNYADQSSLHYNNYSNYGNYSNFPSYSYDTSNNYNNLSYGYGTSDSLYNNGRFNAVAQKLSVISNLSEDLNESSIGTHV